jgi:hypothetical protein
MSASRLLGRLEHFKQTGPGRWMARCPAHDDRSPSLSIRELDDGRVLLKDFGGCKTESVLNALNLRMADLFPGPVKEYRPTHSTIPARDLLALLHHEILVAVLILNDVLSRRAVNESQFDRLNLTASRIGNVRDISNPERLISHEA